MGDNRARRAALNEITVRGRPLDDSRTRESLAGGVEAHDTRRQRRAQPAPDAAIAQNIDLHVSPGKDAAFLLEVGLPAFESRDRSAISFFNRPLGVGEAQPVAVAAGNLTIADSDPFGPPVGV